MSWVTHDYVCSECELRKTEMVLRSDVPESIVCDCGGSMARSLWINQTRVSYVDGTNRWQDVKTQRSLKKLARAARNRGDRTEQARINSEISEVRRASRTSKKTESSKVLPSND